MVLNHFMNASFPNLELRPPVFYSWDIGIRFELGVDWKKKYTYPDNPYITGCYKRAITLFESIHSSDDELLIVMDVNDFDKGRNLHRKLKNFSPYIKKTLLYKLNHKKLPYIFPEDDEEGVYCTHRFVLTCKTCDLTYKPLLKAICNHDIGLKPSLFHRVYFLNLTKRTIFHVYDDRGCDLLATSAETIRDVYEKHNDWILAHNRPEIDKLFL